MRLKLITILSLFLCPSLFYGEGSKEFGNYFSANTEGGIVLTSSEDGTRSDFGLYGADSAYQIKIRIADTTEIINLGFQMRLVNHTLVEGIPFRILDPLGNEVYNSAIPGAGDQGFVNSFQEVTNGPNVNGVTNGYDPLVYSPDTIGDFVLEFDLTYDDFDALGTNLVPFRYFDVTVIDSLEQTQLGRLHSRAWQLSSGSYTQNPVEATVYPYHPNGVIFEVDLNGMRPWLFSLYFNSFGTDTTGIIAVDRQSKIGYFPYGEFEVFLNPPDESLYPVYTQSLEYTASITRTDCESSLFCLEFSSQNEGVVDGFIDFNGNFLYEPEIGDLLFVDVIDSTGSTCIEWNGLDANGNPVSNKEIQMVTQFGSGTMHFPLYDIEHNPNGYKVGVYSPSLLPDPSIYWDDSQLNGQGNTLGSPIVNLTGCLSDINSGCHKWIDRGQIGGNRDLQEMVNTWWFAQVEFDTLVFDYTPNFPVEVSYNPNSVDKEPRKVCAGDTVDFYVFNNTFNHYDPTLYEYYWFKNGAVEDTLLITDSVFHFTAEEASMINLYAVFRSNESCFSFDSIEVEVVTPILADVIVEPMVCFQTITEASISFISGGQENPVINWDLLPNYHLPTRNDLVEYETYSFTIIDENYSERCSFDTTFEVSGIRSLEIASIVDDSTLCYESTGDISIAMVDQEVMYSYSWQGGAFQDKTELTNLTADNYTIAVRDDSTGCILDTVIPVVSLPIDIEVVVTNEVCHDSSGTVNVSIPSEILNVLWEDGSTDTSRTNLTSDTYEVRVWSDLHTNCSAEETISIVNIDHEVIIDKIELTNVDCIIETGSANVIMDPYDDSTTYSIIWSDLSGLGYTKDFEREDLTSFNYSFIVQEDGGYCFGDSSFVLTRGGHTFDANGTPTICTSEIGEVTVVVDNSDFTISWLDINSNSFTRDRLGSGDYFFRLENIQDPSCNIDTFITVGSSDNELNADFEIEHLNEREDNLLIVDDSIMVRNTSGTQTQIVNWEMSDGSTPIGNEFMVTFTSFGEYEIILRIEDEYGCKDTITKPVRVTDFKECGIAMPNAFTPNEDGVNDDIGILGYADETELRIYNRWGEIVFRSFDIEERWDGFFKDGESPIGTYVFQLEHTCLNIRGEIESSDFEMGQITLIR